MGADVIGKKDMILNRNIASQSGPVRKDIIVANNAVVGYVNSHHKKVARANTGAFSLFAGAMQSAEFTDEVVVSDFEVTPFTFEFHILRFAAQYGVLKHAVTGPHASEAFDDRVRPNFAVWTYCDVVFDDRVSTDGNAVCQSCPGTDNC